MNTEFFFFWVICFFSLLTINGCHHRGTPTLLSLPLTCKCLCLSPICKSRGRNAFAWGSQGCQTTTSIENALDFRTGKGGLDNLFSSEAYLLKRKKLVLLDSDLLPWNVGCPLESQLESQLKNNNDDRFALEDWLHARNCLAAHFSFYFTQVQGDSHWHSQGEGTA